MSLWVRRSSSYFALNKFASRKKWFDKCFSFESQRSILEQIKTNLTPKQHRRLCL